MFAMMYFLGFTIGNLFIPKLMDSYGRKKIFVSCMYGQLATLLAMLTIPPHDKHGQYMMYFLLFINGISSVGRVNCGVIYFMEVAPANYSSTLGTTWNVIEGSVVIFLTVYYRFFSTYWEGTI